MARRRSTSRTRALGRLHWAGEATANDAEASTVHGALLSGLRAAKEVLGA